MISEYINTPFSSLQLAEKKIARQPQNMTCFKTNP